MCYSQETEKPAMDEKISSDLLLDSHNPNCAIAAPIHQNNLFYQ